MNFAQPERDIQLLQAFNKGDFPLPSVEPLTISITRIDICTRVYSLLALISQNSKNVYFKKKDNLNEHRIVSVQID